MDHLLVLIAIGFVIGTLGTLIGAGGGFILVPLLLITRPSLSPEIVTAISIAIVGANALSGSIAYGVSRRIDYKAGILFALFTIPGSILGVFTVKYISKTTFDILFGILLLGLSGFLFWKPSKEDNAKPQPVSSGSNWKNHELTDKNGESFSYSYNQRLGVLISIVVGYLSPLLGIGGGIIHVPALVRWLHFPVHVATATSHFILAVMSLVSVAVHICNGSYHSAYILHMLMGLGIGVVGGAQLGAYLSHRIKGTLIIRALALSLAVVGVRLLVQSI